jgi:hypothetical protein
VGIHVLRDVFERATGLLPVERGALLDLADHADDESRACWPSIERLAARQDVHRATIIRALNRLVDLGYVLRDGRHHGARRYVVTVASAWPAPVAGGRAHATSRTHATSRAHATSTSRTHATSVVAPTRHEPSENHQENQKLASLAVARERRAPAPKRVGWPEDFALTDKLREFGAQVEGLDVELEWASFKDHHHAVASRFASWEGAWRNWVRNAWRFQARRSGGRR